MTTSSPLDPVSIEKQAVEHIKNGQFIESEKLVRALLASGSGPMRYWKLLALTLNRQHRHQEAAAIQAMLVDHSPGDLACRFDLSETLLMCGDFERGWREYHYRYSLPHTTRIERKVQMPRWDGRAIPGQTLLIHDEQGYGDTFQFLRLLPEVKRRSGAKIILEIDRVTLSFAQRMEGIDVIIPRGQLPPPFQVHCELMSLPMAMGLKMADLPASPMPYLKPDPARLEKWQKRLADLPRPLVALTWNGRATPNPKRSIPFVDLAPLALDGITFVSIQKGDKAAEAKNPPAGMHLVDLNDEIKDFDDTAAILCLADLLISIDSGPVHLAGALARPAWVMLLHNADWRWFPHREDSPWYPSMRLFRQPTFSDDWSDVVQRVANQLAVWRDQQKRAA